MFKIVHVYFQYLKIKYNEITPFIIVIINGYRSLFLSQGQSVHTPSGLFCDTRLLQSQYLPLLFIYCIYVSEGRYIVGIFKIIIYNICFCGYIYYHVIGVQLN